MMGALSEEVLVQVVMKPTAKEVWDSLKVRFIGTDRVRAAQLMTLRGDFDRLRMAGGEDMDGYTWKLVKKLLDIVPNRLYPAFTGIEQFCNINEMAFEEALGRLKAFDERTRHHRRTEASVGATSYF